MISIPRLHHLLCLLALNLGLRPAAAQDAFAKEEQDLIRQCIGTLTDFANIARVNKVGQRAKQAFDLVLGYDANNSNARTELGFRKEKTEWIALPAEKRKKWVDKATFEGRFKILDAWYKTSMKLSALHRVLGLKMKEANNLAKATYHLEKATYYNPMDKEANLGLGYKEGSGFYGTDEQIVFAKRMKEIEKTAVELARKTDYELKELPPDQMPKELQLLQENAPEWMKKPDMNIVGARTKHFTVWTRGQQEEANTSAMWGERAIDFGLYLLGDDMAKRLQFVERASRAFSWYGFLSTQSEREEFLKANPNVWEKEGSMDKAKDFANNMWLAKEGGAVAMVRASPKSRHDTMIGYVFHNGLVQGRNEGLGQGIIHAMTWYLKSTSIVRWGARPEGSVGDDALDLPDGANWWLRAVRDQAMSNQDWPLNQVPREQLKRFRNECRLKSWSFATWVVAAYPDKWLKYYMKFPAEKILTVEEVEAIGLDAFGKPLAQLEADWREWARGDSGVAYGTGYGPPLLPERPSKEELAVIDRLNAVRAHLLAFTWGTGGKPTEGAFAGMPPCELDAEASIGCDAHAKYVCAYPELSKKETGEIHEENPANPEFTRRGQLAGGGNIVWATGQRGVDFARDTVDMWISTPYHRFPMLEHNIWRVGYSYVYENDFSVAVLDMGSLAEPYDPNVAPKLVAWPPHNMKDVPTSFGSPENPNPLADQPDGEQDVTKCGYTISLQLQEELSLQLGEASIQLFESRKGGKPPAKNCCPKDGEDFKGWTDRCKPKEIPCYVHTPKAPLNKKRDLKDVLFLLPKEPLEAGQQFQVRALMKIGPMDPLWFIWEFTTGTQREGLKLK